MRALRRLGVAAALLAMGAAACGPGRIREDPILRLSAEEAFEKGKELLAAGKYSQARDHLTHVFEVEPNSAIGREALLMVADAYYDDGALENWIKAEEKYRDFLNRFPTSDRAAYVQFRIAKSLAHRILKPDRDQTATHAALNAFDELLRLYPETEDAEEAESEIARLRLNLAEHEFLVGHFNLKVGLAPAAVARLERLLEDYPEYPETDKALFFLARAYRATGQEVEAVVTEERLRNEHPESEYLSRLGKA